MYSCWQVWKRQSWKHIFNYWILDMTHLNLRSHAYSRSCIFKVAGAAVGRQSRRHGGAFVGLAPPSKQSPKPSQIELWSTIDRWSFYQISECQAPMNRRKAPLLKPFSRRFCREGGAVKQLNAMKTYKKSLPIVFVSVHQQCWPQKQ